MYLQLKDQQAVNCSSSGMDSIHVESEEEDLWCM